MADLGIAQGPVSLSVGVASQKVPVALVDQTNYRTLETGISSPTIEISKNGAAFAAPSDGTWAEISDGYYTVRLNVTDTNTEGWLLLRVIKASVSAETLVYCEVGTSPADNRVSYLQTRTIHRSNR
jgi:hypothetical protein